MALSKEEQNYRRDERRGMEQQGRESSLSFGFPSFASSVFGSQPGSVHLPLDPRIEQARQKNLRGVGGNMYVKAGSRLS